MTALVDLDSLLYHSVYKIVSFTQIRELLSVNIDTKPYSERRNLAFDYIIDEALDRLGHKLLKIYSDIEETGFNLSDYKLYVTNCSDSIRKKINPYYKSNRKRNKWIESMRSKIIDQGDIIFHDQWEADDLIANEAKRLNDAGLDYIILSIDKDLKQICGWHFDYYPIYEKDTNGVKTFKQLKGLSYTTVKDAWNMLAMQVICGDPVDRIKGIKGMGVKKASKILNGCNTYKDYQIAVIRTYIENSSKFEENDWRSALYETYRMVYLGFDENI